MVNEMYMIFSQLIEFCRSKIFMLSCRKISENILAKHDIKGLEKTTLQRTAHTLLRAWLYEKVHELV